MTYTKQLISDYSDLITEHRSWLKPFGTQRHDKWEKLLKANPESAICEAATKKLLSNYTIKVEPYEDLSKGGPDFLCTQNSKNFYVEVTCITIEAATRETGLKIDSSNRGHLKNLLTKKIFGEMKNKTPQLRELDAPSILTIGTLHGPAGHKCFRKPHCSEILTGTTKISFKFDPKKGQTIGGPYQSTDLKDSGFIRKNKNEENSIEDARKTISALLLCSFGIKQQKPIGVLHPNSNQVFDRALLNQIEFCRLAEGFQNGELTVEWI